MKRLTIIGLALLVLVVVGLGSFQVVRIQRPAMPGQWSQVHRGMTPDQVRSIVADEVFDLRSVQGFDLVVHTGHYGHWQMIVRYDTTGGVSTATARYIHTAGKGLLSSGGKKVL